MRPSRGCEFLRGWFYASGHFNVVVIPKRGGRTFSLYIFRIENNLLKYSLKFNPKSLCLSIETVFEITQS